MLFDNSRSWLTEPCVQARGQNVARRNGKTATFMPSALRGQRLGDALSPVDLEG